MITRRASRRMFLLRPGERTNKIIGYLLAVYARRRGLRLHAVCFLSNHEHLVATDPKGKVVDFTRDFHSMVARHINASFDDFENLWSTEQTNLVRLAEPVDVIDKIAYTMANPVLSGLVKHGRSWPGIRRAWPAKPRVYRRPAGFLRDPGSWPATATLEMERPPGREDLTDAERAAEIAEAIEARESEGRAAVARKGRRFLGRRAILRQPRHGRPWTREPRGGISPRHACKNKWLRVERLMADRAWLDRYDACYQRWRSGDHDVVFPYGTYKLRVQHGARVAPT